MFKSIIKFFIPSSKKLSQMAAESIAKAINQSEKEAQIAKYSSMAASATEIQKFVLELLVDGKIDETEQKAISEKLEPLMSKILELI